MAACNHASAGVVTPTVSKPPLANSSMAAAATLNVRDTAAAGAKVKFPCWLAKTVQGPADSSASAVPLTSHTDGVEDSKVTTRGDVVVADRVTGDDPKVWGPGPANVRVCEARLTLKLRSAEAGANIVLPG